MTRKSRSGEQFLTSFAYCEETHPVSPDASATFIHPFFALSRRASRSPRRTDATTGSLAEGPLRTLSFEAVIRTMPIGTPGAFPSGDGAGAGATSGSGGGAGA